MGRRVDTDFEQRVAAMDRAHLAEIVSEIAAAWDRDDFEDIGVILEDNALTAVGDDDDDDRA